MQPLSSAGGALASGSAAIAIAEQASAAISALEF
jgi:hypothetical protein